MYCYICLGKGMACIVISVWVKELHALLYLFGQRNGMHCYICLGKGMACIVISVWVKEWHALLYLFG